MKKMVIDSDKFPKTALPYSLAVYAGDLVFTAGQVAWDFKTGKYLTEADIRSQTRQVLENLKVILRASESSLDRVIKTTVFLSDWNDYDGMNEVYREYFGAEPPARSTVQVAKLSRGLKVEIEAVATRL